MTTAIVQIGNSDDKLPQRKWAQFSQATNMVICRFSNHFHFFGHSHPASIRQNACWVFELNDLVYADLCKELAILAETFGQDSIALTTGNTELVESESKRGHRQPT